MDESTHLKHSTRMINESLVASKIDSHSTMEREMMTRSRDSVDPIVPRELKQDLGSDDLMEHFPNGTDERDIPRGTESGNMEGYRKLISPIQKEELRRENEKVGEDSINDGNLPRDKQGEVMTLGLDSSMLPNRSALLLKTRRSVMRAQLITELQNASEMAVNSRIASTAGLGEMVGGTSNCRKWGVEQINLPMTLSLKKPVVPVSTEGDSEASTLGSGRGVVAQIKPRPLPTFPSRPKGQLAESRFNLGMVLEGLSPRERGYSVLPSLRLPPQLTESDDACHAELSENTFAI